MASALSIDEAERSVEPGAIVSVSSAGPHASIVREVRRCASVTELRACMRSLADALGFDACNYIHLGHSFGSRHMVDQALPARFVSTSDRDGGGNRSTRPPMNPAVVDRVRATFTPFIWPARGEFPMPVSGGSRRSPHRREGGVKAVIPVQDYVAGSAYLELSGTEEANARRLIEEQTAELHFVATQFHLAAIRVSPLSDRGHGLVLTSREIECLRLAALGWTVAESGEILKISARTVEFHLKNVAEKLDAPNKLCAVALAVSGGLIDF